MTRLILIEAILFLIPFALYFVWRAVLERKEAATGGRFNERPWQMLIVAGGVLAIGGLIAFAVIGSGRGDSVYIPAYVEDGRVVPGRFVPADEAGELADIDPKARRLPPAPTGEADEDAAPADSAQ